jgi:hypothetical protein
MGYIVDGNHFEICPFWNSVIPSGFPMHDIGPIFLNKLKLEF